MLQFTLNDLTPRQLEFIEKTKEIFLASPSTISGHVYNQEPDEQSVLTREAALRARDQLNSRFDDPEFIAQADKILAEDAQDTSGAKLKNQFPGGPIDFHLDLFVQWPETIDLNPPKATGIFEEEFDGLKAELGLDRCEQVAAARAVKAIQAARANMPKGATGMPTLHDYRYTEGDAFECHRCGDTVSYEGKQQKIAAGEICVTIPLEQIRQELGIKSSLSAKPQE